VAELWYGVERARTAHKGRREHFLRTVLELLPIIPYTELAAYEHARLRAFLVFSGKVSGSMTSSWQPRRWNAEVRWPPFKQSHFGQIPGSRSLSRNRVYWIQLQKLETTRFWAAGISLIWNLSSIQTFCVRPTRLRLKIANCAAREQTVGPPGFELGTNGLRGDRNPLFRNSLNKLYMRPSPCGDIGHLLSSPIGIASLRPAPVTILSHRHRTYFPPVWLALFGIPPIPLAINAENSRCDQKYNNTTGGRKDYECELPSDSGHHSNPPSTGDDNPIRRQPEEP